MLVDSHCHLDFDVFNDDREDAIARALEAGVGTLVTICTHLSKFDAVRAIAAAHERVWCSVGIHPHQVAEEGVAPAARLVELAGDPLVVGIGETGLDYYYDHSPRDDQRANFRAHIAAARLTGLPVIVHLADGTEFDLVREGETGIRLARGRPEDFRAAIIELAADAERAAGYGAAGQRLVETELNMNAMVDRIVDVSYRALERRRHGRSAMPSS